MAEQKQRWIINAWSFVYRVMELAKIQENLISGHAWGMSYYTYTVYLLFVNMFFLYLKTPRIRYCLLLVLFAFTHKKKQVIAWQTFLKYKIRIIANNGGLLKHPKSHQFRHENAEIVLQISNVNILWRLNKSMYSI